MGLYYYSPFRLLLLERPSIHPSSAGRCGVIRPSIGPQHNFPGKVNLFDTARQNTQWADFECGPTSPGTIIFIVPGPNLFRLRLSPPGRPAIVRG